MHKYFEEVAVELNNAGVSQALFVEGFAVDHTKESVKGIWRAILKKKYEKSGTHELTTKEVGEVFDEFNRHLATFGLHIPFPGTYYPEGFEYT